MYGHVNNVQYYSYMDTVINSYLIATRGVLQPVTSPVIGLCITSGCTFHASLTFPDVVRTCRCCCPCGLSASHDVLRVVITLVAHSCYLGGCQARTQQRHVSAPA